MSWGKRATTKQLKQMLKRSMEESDFYGETAHDYNEYIKVHGKCWEELQLRFGYTENISGDKMWKIVNMKGGE